MSSRPRPFSSFFTRTGRTEARRELGSKVNVTNSVQEEENGKRLQLMLDGMGAPLSMLGRVVRLWASESSGEASSWWVVVLNCLNLMNCR